MALVFSNVRERLVAENHSPLKCLSCVVIVFEVLISNALVDRIEVDSSNFHYGFFDCISCVTLVDDRIAWALNISCVT